MVTKQSIIYGNANNLKSIPDKSVHLVVTSPPYPMVEMWDEAFSSQDKSIAEDLKEGKAKEAFNKMHKILNEIWEECQRVVADGGFICINIGDATRTFNNHFQLFSNHTKIIEHFVETGWTVLPDIHWRKPTNSPNKFMGSGMYPAGAYVTYEHEYILVFRNGEKRAFNKEEKENRHKSAFFWEERNVWFSDLWEVKGINQELRIAARERSGAFPIEIPYRLINMYSCYGDTILDPFAGTGTTGIACMITGRNSIGVEIIDDIAKIAIKRWQDFPLEAINIINRKRLQAHEKFIQSLPQEKQDKCYQNEHHQMLVKTKQEMELQIRYIREIEEKDDGVICVYDEDSDPHLPPHFDVG